MRFYEVGYKHWWYRLIPRYRRNRAALQSYFDGRQEEINRLLNEQIVNLTLFGHSHMVIKPEDFYGKGNLYDERPNQD